ncbi:general transcription factor IIIC polypeptide 3 GTF3C3 [Toxoplasma gondii MAS]|uniref:General transcription factor IIIC polypeptide 3 GTF3C3 n=2 Tax=Toxoplasma gondii TaxID=5811 RepID=A0A2G8Y072_TOXGO|nr:general transcription factor IIIC polypeptide 3 GTF3C3 [Toxoplasma gondii MAS]PIM00675.1 general transcription factor IIIC polypeptide 3 GTF3C3 [Toxoplasma gondii COUG]
MFLPTRRSCVSCICAAGLKGYFDFLCSGVELLRRQCRHEEAVALLEAVLSNWRQKRPDGNDAQKRQIKEELEVLSISLSVEGRLSRTALASLRHLLQRRASISRHRGSWRSLLEVYGRLLFTGRLAQQASKALAVAREKDLFLENRSWTIRQLLQRPHSDALTLIVGHFCMLSSRWRFAVAEYTRTHCLRPREPLPCLCLAVAYLCLSTSNKTQNKHDMVLRGFAMLGRYSQLRRETQEDAADICQQKNASYALEVQTVRMAETLYNLARAYHHVNLLHLAVPLYLRCLDLLDKTGDTSSEAHGNSFPFPQKPWLPSQGENGHDNSCAGIAASKAKAGSITGSGAERSGEAAIQLDKAQIQKCAALNLMSIWRSQGGLAQARAVASRYLVWDAE